MNARSVLFLATAWLLAACAGGSGDLTGTGGGGGGQPIRPPVTPPLPPSPALSGLVAVAAGDGIIRADFDLPGDGFESAIFFGTERSTLFDGTPAFEGLTGDNVVIPGVANVQTLVGMAIRATGATAWTPVGSVLRCHPTTTIVYVDASADPLVANGLTPATAYPSLANGLLRAGLLAFQGESPNVLVRDGVYSDGTFSIAPDTHVYGGFQAGFDFATRDPRSGNTLLNGAADPGRMIVDVLSGSLDSVLDGLAVDGRGLITEGIDVTDSECELRSISIRRLRDRGSRVRTFDFSVRRDVLMVACEISENDNGGLGISGTVDLTLDRCAMNSNAGEGADFNDMIAGEGQTATLKVTGCQFFGNGTQGLDVDFAPPAFAAQSPGGLFLVQIEGCTFERNGTEGLLLDQDYELWPNWYSQIRVRDCDARANGDAGVHIDADNPGDYVIDRLRSTANLREGLLITSETNAGQLTVSSSYFGGNLTQGIRTTLGNKMVLATHCIFAGNQLGGFTADIPPTVPGFAEGAATSCIAWRQPDPWTNVRTVACYVEDAVNPFENVPNGFAIATAHLNGALTLQSGIGIDLGDTVEVADDRVARLVTAALPTDIVVDPAPVTFVPPDAVALFGGTSVDEDFRLPANSAALGTGLTPPGGNPVDPGPHGMPTGGRPGQYDPFAVQPMHLLSMIPAITAGVLSTDPIVLTFDRDLDTTTTTQDFVRCVGPGGEIPASINPNARTITLLPPSSGWPGAFVLELNIGLTAADGTPFGGGLSVPIHLR